MPININQCIIGGRVAGEPKILTLQNGSSKVRFAVAVSRFTRLQDGTFREETSFVNIEAFGYLVERVAKNLHKGTTVIVRGQIREDHWEDRSTGTNKFRTYILAENVDYYNAEQQRGQAPQKGGQPQGPQNQPYNQNTPPPPPPPQGLEQDDIPF